jgi:hypothetical protein
MSRPFLFRPSKHAAAETESTRRTALALAAGKMPLTAA